MDTVFIPLEQPIQKADLVPGRKYIIALRLNNNPIMIARFDSECLSNSESNNTYSYFSDIESRFLDLTYTNTFIFHDNGHYYYDTAETIAIKRQIEMENHTIQLVFGKKNIPHVLSLYVNEYNTFS